MFHFVQIFSPKKEILLFLHQRKWNICFLHPCNNDILRIFIIFTYPFLQYRKNDKIVTWPQIRLKIFNIGLQNVDQSFFNFFIYKLKPKVEYPTQAGVTQECKIQKKNKNFQKVTKNVALTRN